MKIAVDAMGGDFAPMEVVKGAVDAANDFNLNIILVGDEKKVNEELKKYSFDSSLISIVHASEVIEMHEHPALAFRKKKDASVIVCNNLVREGIADAVVAAGSTGAAMTASLLRLGRIKGIERPAIALVIPTLKKGTVLLDVGANTDCTPQELVQFAIMGNAYAKKILGVIEPKVALLNIGEEESKGNAAVQKAYELLKNSSLNFVGNVEGRDIPKGDVDVIVCDGFVGNIVLKLTEGLAKSIFLMIKEELQKTFRAKLGALLAFSQLKGLRNRMDYAETGGAILLGVQGVSIIAHGSSNAKAIKNAIKVAARFAETGLVQEIAEKIHEEIENNGEKNA